MTGRVRSRCRPVGSGAESLESFAVDEARREGDRFDHAGLIGEALAGDIERRAVVDRGTDNGQAEVYADASFEAVDLDGDVPLVVIHHDHDVVLSGDGGVED